jgi:hypothetical protein
MLVLAPTRLVLGSIYAAYDLDVTQVATNAFGLHGAIGRLLNQKGGETAECAIVFVPIPDEATLSRGGTVTFRVRSVDLAASTLKGDTGQWMDCKTDGMDGDCEAAFSRLDYRPSALNQTYEGFKVIHTRFKNWYSEKGIFKTNPRQVEMSLYFRPPPGWSPDSAAIGRLFAWLHQNQGEQDFSAVLDQQ